MDDNDAAAPRSASPDDTDHVLQSVKQMISAQQRKLQLALERDMQSLADAEEKREQDMRAMQQQIQQIEQKLRQLEREKATDDNKKSELKARYDQNMIKLNRVLEDCAVSRPSSVAPQEVKVCIHYQYIF